MQETQIGSRLMEVSDLTQLAGAVAAVFFITNTVKHVFKWNPRWFGLVVSLLVACLTCLLSGGSAPSWQAWALALPNACLIYASAVGLSSITGAHNGARATGGSLPPSPIEEISTRIPFWSPWY